MDIHLDIDLSSKYNCRHVAAFLSTIQFKCKIVPYISVDSANNSAIDSCSIIFSDKSPAEIKTVLWVPLKRKFLLDDAILHIPYIYSGSMNRKD